MNLFKKLAVIFILITLGSCLKVYEPQIDSINNSKYVVSGQLTNQEGYQYISVSKTSSLDEPFQKPISGCDITIIDDKSNTFVCEETNIGKYRVWMAKNDLCIGTSYMIEIYTPEGNQIISSHEKMYPTGEIDTIYYQREDIPAPISAPYDFIKGVRFYLDMHGTDESSRFYKYGLTETWEYHVDNPITWYYDGTMHHVDPPDYSKMVCWRTRNIGDIFVLSTDNLSTNEYKKASLSFVNNRSQRLKYMYSLLITQYSLSKEAYTYWKKLQTNVNQDGGLYSSQPISITGNLYNPDNTKQKVLGYFSVSAISKKRVFIKDIEDLEIEAPGCGTIELRKGLRDLTPLDYPAYFMGDHDMPFTGALLTKPCVDCLQMGGTNIKPDFWPY